MQKIMYYYYNIFIKTSIPSICSYKWSQTVINTAGNVYTNPGFSTNATITFTVGVCQNADTSNDCKGPGAVFMVSDNCGNGHLTKKNMNVLLRYSMIKVQRSALFLEAQMYQCLSLILIKMVIRNNTFLRNDNLQ